MTVRTSMVWASSTCLLVSLGWRPRKAICVAMTDRAPSFVIKNPLGVAPRRSLRTAHRNYRATSVPRLFPLHRLRLNLLRGGMQFDRLGRQGEKALSATMPTPSNMLLCLCDCATPIDIPDQLSPVNERPDSLQPVDNGEAEVIRNCAAAEPELFTNASAQNGQFVIRARLARKAGRVGRFIFASRACRVRLACLAHDSRRRSFNVDP